MPSLSPKTVAISTLVVVSFIASGYATYQNRKFKTWLKLGEEQIRAQSIVNKNERATLMQSLPPLMAQYIEKVHPQPNTRVVEFQQTGLFWMNPASKGMRFAANQVVSATAFEFSWFADIMLGPLSIFVCDRLIDGAADLKASLLGSLPFANESGSQLLRGELLRYLAEMPWSPAIAMQNTSLHWKQTSNRSVEVSTQIQTGKVALEVFFDDKGLIERVYANEREYKNHGAFEKHPWEGVFSNYQLQDGVLIPMHGEVSWILDSGKFTYFKGDITDYRITQ